MTAATNERPRWRNPDRPPEERIHDLISRMTLEEKISQLTTNPAAVDRIGLHAFRWGGECLHGLCNSGRATQFPMPIGMAATFDPKLIERVAEAVSDEARAKYHDPDWGTTRNATLTFYTPVINILRDPRWGRAQETYGEDPYLTAVMGAAFVRGLQGNDSTYLKVAACAKHLGVHSGPEPLRHEFNAEVSRRDLAETYLSAFEALVEAGVAMVMATYNRVNGEHCCASTLMIGEFLRGSFGFEGLVLSDGGALGSLHTTHKITKDAVETAGLCLRNGCDLEIGRHAYPFAAQAIQRGLITEDDIDRALAKILNVRLRVGDLDPIERIPYANISRKVIQSPKHLRLARQTAVESLVLLKNNGVLPLRDVKTVLCTGPNAADIQVLLGNFYRGVSKDLRTVLEGVVAVAPEGTIVTHMQGCFLTHPNVYPSTWTFGLSEWADVVVAVVGYSPLMEGEQGECIGAPDGGDKSSIALPPNQLEFLRYMKESGKPLVVVVTGGCPLELEEVHELADAVLMAWYPGEQGGMAVGDILFGHKSPSGKLPATFPKKLEHLPAYVDYAMAGRTYRYMGQEPMYPFGFGLSYTTFAYSDLTLACTRLPIGQSSTARVNVTNTGERRGEEVVQLYIRREETGSRGPRWALRGFKRIALKPGQNKTVTFRISPEMMSAYDETGAKVLEPGTFTVWIGGSSPVSRAQALGAPPLERAQFVVTP